MYAIHLFVLFLAAVASSFGNFPSAPEGRVTAALTPRSDSDRPSGEYGSFGNSAATSTEVRTAAPTATSFGKFLPDCATVATGRVLAARMLVRRGEFVRQKPTVHAGAVARDTS